MLEAAEQPLARLRVNAGTCVGHHHAEPRIADALQVQVHASLRRELHGIGRQVGDHLLEPGDVAHHPALGRRVGRQVERHALLVGVRRQELADIADGVAQGERLADHLERPGLHARQVQNVAKQAVEGRTGALDDLHQFSLGLVQPAQRQGVGHAQDTVERRADLVAHVGQEGALGPVRRLRRVAGQGQIVRRLFERGDVHDADHAAAVVGVALQDPVPLAVGRQLLAGVGAGETLGQARLGPARLRRAGERAALGRRRHDAFGVGQAENGPKPECRQGRFIVAVP